MLRVGEQLVAGGHLPDTLGVVAAAVGTGRQQLLAVRAELERADRATLPGQRAQEAPGAAIPQPNLAVLAA